MLSATSENVPQTMLSQSAPPQSVPQTMLSECGPPHDVVTVLERAPDDVVGQVRERAPDDVVDRVEDRAPDDVVVVLQRAPDDVVAVAVAGRAPDRSELERVRLRPDEAASQTVAAPVDLLAPFPAEVQPISRLRGLEEPRELHGSFGVQEAGTLSERVVAACSAVPCTAESPWPCSASAKDSPASSARSFR